MEEFERAVISITICVIKLLFWGTILFCLTFY
nr:MAG TPA: hypothetical protein [Caudoviricetes sp.]